MNFEDFKIGDVVYNEKGDGSPSYFLVAWKNDDNKTIGGFIGFKDTNLPKTCTIDIGNDVTIMNQEQFMVEFYDEKVRPNPVAYVKREPDVTNGKEWANTCELKYHLDDEEMGLFLILANYLNDENTERVGYLSVKDMGDKKRELCEKLVRLNKARKEAIKAYDKSELDFVMNYYPGLLPSESK